MKSHLSLLVSLLTAFSLGAQETKDTPAPAKAESADDTKPAGEAPAEEGDTTDAPTDQEEEDAQFEELVEAAEQAGKDEVIREAAIAAERKKAEGEEMEELVTVEGRTFNKVVISGVDDLGIRIRHEAGTARVRFELVSKELQKRFGYDPDAADEQKRLERQRAAAFARAAIAGLRARREMEDPKSSRTRPSSPAASSKPAPTATPVTGEAGERIAALEAKIAVAELGITKFEDNAMKYEEKAAGFDRRALRGTSPDDTDPNNPENAEPTTAAGKWRAKAYAEYAKIEKARELVAKYRKEIRAIKRGK